MVCHTLMEVINMDAKKNVYIESYSEDKLISSYDVSLNDWYENDIEEIDNEDYIKDNKIDKVKIFCGDQLNVNRYNHFGFAYSFDTYDKKYNHIYAERVIYNGERMIGNMDLHIEDEITGAICIFNKNSENTEMFTVNLKYECGLKTINTYTYHMRINEKLNISFFNEHQKDQKCTIIINNDDTDEMYVVDIEL